MGKVCDSDVNLGDYVISYYGSNSIQICCCLLLDYPLVVRLNGNAYQAQSKKPSAPSDFCCTSQPNIRHHIYKSGPNSDRSSYGKPSGFSFQSVSMSTVWFDLVGCSQLNYDCNYNSQKWLNSKNWGMPLKTINQNYTDSARNPQQFGVENNSRRVRSVKKELLIFDLA